LVQALRTPSAVAKTVEVFSTDVLPVSDWGTTFAAASPDEPGSLDGAQDRPDGPLDREPARLLADLRRFRAITAT
jgi:hypothetical protein